jgi:hypothetical protein
MRTIYEMGLYNIWTGRSREITDREGRPPNWICTTLAPPEGIAQWSGNSWIVLDEYPAQLPTEEQIQESIQASVRAVRNALLKDSDWTQVADAPVDKAAWATHRQALRDITTQEGFPQAVQWPVAP